jgi:glycosyltransferase involved in cell wall biosynthesis
MRILMLSQFFYPPTVGGEERFVADLSHELAARGHDISVITFWQKGFPAFEVDQGVKVYRVRGSIQKMNFLFSEGERPYAPPFPDPWIVSELRRIIQQERPEIIHAHNWLVHSFTPLKTWSKAKLILSLHDYSHVCVQKRLMRQQTRCTGPGLTKCLSCSTQFYGLAKGPLTTLANFFWAEQERRAVDMFLPVSQAVVEGNLLDHYRVPHQVIPNFVPDNIETCDDNDPLLSQLPAGDFLLFVGDVTFDKGAKTLLQAYAEVETQVPLVLIGRPFDTAKDEHLPSNVLLLGRWPHEAVMGAWKRCTFGLVPSIVAETFGIAALEAMYMGKPVIAARSGGLVDVVVDGETGLLVPPGNVEALRTAIQALLDDPSRRKQMGIQARQRALEFLASSVVTRFERIYQEMLANHPARKLVPGGSR